MRSVPAAAAVALLVALSGCGGGSDDGGGSPPPAERGIEPPAGTDRAPARADGEARAETLAQGLDVPWEMAFMPDGRARRAR